MTIFWFNNFQKISGNVISKGGDNLKVHAAKFSTLSCPVLLYRSKNNFPIHAATSRVKELGPGLVLFIKLCPQTYQINYWMFTGISSSGYNVMCTKRLLVTIKTKSLLVKIYKYTKPYNYLQVYLQKIETQNI